VWNKPIVIFIVIVVIVKADAAQTSAKKLEAKLHQLQASYQLQLDNCKQASDDKLAGKDAELKDMQTKIERLQALLETQVYSGASIRFGSAIAKGRHSENRWDTWRTRGFRYGDNREVRNWRGPRP